MESLRFRIDKIVKGAGKSFYRFPASIISALIISMVAIIRITMEWEIQRPYHFLFDSIQISFVLGAVFSMATVTLNEIKEDKHKSFFTLANIAGILVACISFALLYFSGKDIWDDGSVYLSSIAIARVSVAILVSIIAFIYMVSKSKSINSFSDSFFISHRAFVVSGIYGLVIMLGVSGVLGAFQALIYPSMNYKIYQYVGVGVSLLTYIIFLGYFPGFKNMKNEIEMKRVREQPRFILVLLDYIMTPIIIALTLVLLIWSIRVSVKGVVVSFNALSGIASSYLMIGIWLHIMVAKHKTRIAEFYKKAYPIAGILILLFQAEALFTQLRKFGFKTTEYAFLMIWIFGALSILLLLLLKDRAYRKIAITAGVISIVWVLPIIGYQDITFNSQVKRLEKTLIGEGLLVEDQIVRKDGQIDQETKGEITGAVDFISYSEKTNKPTWFKKDLNKQDTFKDVFGFDKTYGLYPEEPGRKSTRLNLETDMIDISGYSHSLNMNISRNEDQSIGFEGVNGSYDLFLSNESSGIPSITIKQEGRIIIDEDVGEYVADLVSQYLVEGNQELDLGFEDMSTTLEGEGLSVKVIFNSINAYFNADENTTDYYVDLYGIYLRNQ